MIRRTTTAIALALLWAPSNQAFQNSFTGTTASRVSAAIAQSPTALPAMSNGIDMEALDRKNISRKKFGLAPMTPEQFLENEVMVQQLAVQQDQKAADFYAAKSEDQKQQQQKELRSQQQKQARQKFVPSFLEKMMDSVIPDTCESNFDCEAPKVCCDLGAATKVCCSGGSRTRSREGEMMLVPVMIDVGGRPNQY